MDKKWRKSIVRLLPLDGRYSLTVTLNSYLDSIQNQDYGTLQTSVFVQHD